MPNPVINPEWTFGLEPFPTMIGYRLGDALDQIVAKEPADATILKQANVVDALDSTSTIAPPSANMARVLDERLTTQESASRTPYTITPVDISGTLTATVDPANGPHQSLAADDDTTIAVVADSATVQTAVMLDLFDGGHEITLDDTGVEWDDAIAMPDPVDGITTLMLHSPSGATDWQGWQLATRAGS